MGSKQQSAAAEIAPGRRFFQIGDVRLDRIEGRLKRGDVDVPLRSKSLAVLRHLAANPGRVVSRGELLRAVWGGRSVSPSVVRVSVRELREVLGKGVIETVGRQGYRLDVAVPGPVATSAFVGRDRELATLYDLYERSRTRTPLQVFVSGEPGIGKSALIDKFTAAVGSSERAHVATGHCVDLHGSTEPYLPILEAFERLCQEAGSRVQKTLEQCAPSWLLQMPSLLDAETAEALSRRVPNPTRDRMLREFAVALETLASQTPLVLVLEDLHWADASTVDLLAYLGERARPAKLLVVGTYRPVEASTGGHPLRETVKSLVARRRGFELVVEPLSRTEVATYLGHLLSGTEPDEQLADLLYARTDGNPLFLAAIVEHLTEQGGLVARDGRWRLGTDATPVPPSLRELVERDLAGLEDTDRTMLIAASVAGLDFDAATVAAATQMVPEDVEQRCGRLAAMGQLVRETGTTSWPDQTISATYQFLHGLHRDAIYDAISPADRARLHRAIANGLEAAWEREPTRVAAALALHFERGLDASQAIRHHLAAATAARDRLAPREVVAHAEAALALLEEQPSSAERDHAEIQSLLILGPNLLAVRGFDLPKIQPLFIRARDLATTRNDVESEFLARGGLYLAEVTAGDQRRALTLAGDLLRLAERFPIPLFQVIGHTTSGCASYNRGRLREAREHFLQARDAWRPDLPPLQPNMKVLFLGIGALTLQQLEDPASESWAEELREYATAMGDPPSVAHAFNLLAPWHLWVPDNHDRALECAERALAVASEHVIAAHESLARFLVGVARDDSALQHEAFESLQSGGFHVTAPTHRLQMARTHLRQGRHELARRELDLALGEIEDRGEARHLAEVHRAHAACALAAGKPAEAEMSLRAAVTVARDQEARLFERWAREDLDDLLRSVGTARS